jgi:predicted dehydrogenase
MANQKLRAAVIGAGLGGYHGYAYANAPEYELIAVCDLKPEVFERFYDRAKIAPGSIKEYTNYHEMLEKENLDVVSVATPDHLHVNPVCDVSNAGVKGILVEKPIAISLADADRMIETTERNGTKMSVDHTRSWVRSYQGARQVLRDGQIGPITRIVAHHGGRRSMLFRNGTHVVDGICFFADSDPVWVIAAHERGFENYGTEYKGEGGKDPMLDPGSTVIIEFANGARGILNSAKNTPAILEYDIQGPNGRLLVNDKGATSWVTDKPEGTLTQVEIDWNQGYHPYFGDEIVTAVREMAQMVWNDAPSSSPARRARNTLEIMLGALKSQSQDSAKVQLPLPR